MLTAALFAINEARVRKAHASVGTLGPVIAFGDRQRQATSGCAS